MKNSTKIVIGIAAVLALLIIWTISSYNVGWWSKTNR